MAVVTRRADAATPLIGAVAVFAWLSLWLWESTPYGRYLDHGDWTQLGFAARICAALPAGEVVLPALLYIGGWLLMTTAMMLPTALPLIGLFARIVAGRPDARRLTGLLVAGYLSVWAAFGAVAHGLDWVLHAALADNALMAANGWILGAVVIGLAGAFQFSALKYRCLDKCRTPLSFIAQYWQGRGEAVRSFALGAAHGLFCVGCCWALMLLMFVVGTGNVGWMLLLGAVMAAEKTLSFGRHLARPLGVGLLAWAGAIAANGLALT